MLLLLGLALFLHPGCFCLGYNYTGLKFHQHVLEITMKANRVLACIKRSFANLNDYVLLKLYKSMVRPILEYLRASLYIGSMQAGECTMTCNKTGAFFKRQTIILC